jgi:hypothetical protein
MGSHRPPPRLDGDTRRRHRARGRAALLRQLGRGKDRLLELAHADPLRKALVLYLSTNHELDVETVDMLAELADTLAKEGIELRLAAPHTAALELLRVGASSSA